QISESILKGMRKMNITNLYEYLKHYDLSSNSAELVKNSLDFTVDIKQAQRKLVELGQVLGRVFSLEMVIRLGEKGFRSDLINNSISNLQLEINNIMASYKTESQPDIIDDYGDESDWKKFV